MWERSENQPNDAQAKLLGAQRIDWQKVRAVLVVRLRSIGDTVLATPSLYALRRFLPHARIDVLLEDWVAPLLENCPDVDQVITVKRGSLFERARLLPRLRRARYDVAFNLHGGTTSTFLTAASGARHRVGYADYRYTWLYNHAAPPSAELWQRKETHSVEQQLALLGWTGVPVTDRPPTRLSLNPKAVRTITEKLMSRGVNLATLYALVHPAAAFDTKRWASANFARVIEHLHARGLAAVAIAAPHEAKVLTDLECEAQVPLITFSDLSLPEITALAAGARLFVGNDSGIAHIAAAVRTPAVVVFGSSNVAHWRPWAAGAAEVVRESMPCAPCPGYTCAQFEAPECIRRVPVDNVLAAVERMLAHKARLPNDE
ncbi:MAG: glycosyltransferase family 9 protein [Pyrinomonadaceae bacterium]